MTLLLLAVNPTGEESGRGSRGDASHLEFILFWKIYFFTLIN
jgi:hypothetical protein